MEEKKNRQDKISIILAIIYFVILTWIILFKMQFSLENLQGIRSINLVPFGESVIVNGKVDFDEIIGNILIFIPAGLYFNMLKKDWRFSQKVCSIFGISLIYEILQYIFAIGATDITDLITNTSGGILGMGIYALFHKICKSDMKTNRFLNILGGIGTGLVILLLFILVIAN